MKVYTTHTAREGIKFMCVFKVFNIPSICPPSVNYWNIVVVKFRFFKLYLKIKIVLRSGIRVSQSRHRHRTCSFTDEQSLMPLSFVQVILFTFKRNVCFTVKEYMYCSFVTDWSNYLLIKRSIFKLYEVLSYMFGLLNE